MNSHPVPQFLHVNQRMESHRELGQSSMDSGMDEKELGGRSRGSKSLRDMLPSFISWSLGTLTHSLRICKHMPQGEGLLFGTLECLALFLLHAGMETTPSTAAEQPSFMLVALAQAIGCWFLCHAHPSLAGDGDEGTPGPTLCLDGATSPAARQGRSPARDGVIDTGATENTAEIVHTNVI